MPNYMFDAAYSPRGVNWPARGAIALSHYLTGPYASTSPNMAATQALGLGVNLNWERMPNALVGITRSEGQDIGKDALAACEGVPRGTGRISVKFSVDVNVADAALCDAGFQGVNDVLAADGLLVGCYAQGTVIDRLASLGLVQLKQWLSGSSSFPGFNVRDTRVGAVQSHDAAGAWLNTPVPGTDVNTVLDPANFGIWWPASSPFYPKPEPAVTVDPSPEDDVAAFLFSCANAPHNPTAVYEDLSTCRRYVSGGEWKARGRPVVVPLDYTTATVAKLPVVPGTRDPWTEIH